MIIKSTGCGMSFFSNIRPTGNKLPVRGDSARVNHTKTFGGVLRGKTDTIEISTQRTDGGCSVLKEAKEKLLGDIGRAADPGTLNDLKDRIAAGSYHVDPGELAQILSE